MTGPRDDREGDNAADEPNLGAAERHPVPSGYSYGDQKQNHTGALERVMTGKNDGDDLEPSLLGAEYRYGRIEIDLKGDGFDDEYSHGWTEHIDHNKALMGCGSEWTGEGEPGLGFVGIATGWRESEDRENREADQLGSKAINSIVG